MDQPDLITSLQRAVAASPDEVALRLHLAEHDVPQEPAWWDVDAALRRPGRLDRTLLVLPPDLEARIAIWYSHLRERPVAGIDVTRLAKATEGYTGADITHLCESAAGSR